MGIKLDWQIESEQTRTRATEDPEMARRRRHARRQLIVLLLLLACVIGGIGAAIVWRLRQVDNQLRQDLLDTVSVEVTALRLDDFAGFMAVQRSASDTFLLDQSRQFDEYQTLKQQHRVELSGDVVSAAIDGQRGRVVVNETVDGVPYHVVWFYWHYEDIGASDQGGWRHVPADLTFWGEARTLTSGPVTIDYHALDEDLAQAMLPRLAAWWENGCTILVCAAPAPAMTVEIVAEYPMHVEWVAGDPSRLRVTSPLVTRERADAPLLPDLEPALIEAITGRLVRYAAADAAAPYYADATWLQDELARWLAGELLGTPAGDPGFIESVTALYGPTAPLTILSALTAASTVDDALRAVTGVNIPLLTIDQLSDLDWRGFFAWRLALEPRLLAQPDSSGAFLSLYNLQNLSASSEAALRLESPAYGARPVPDVARVTLTRDANSDTYATVETTRVENGVTVAGETIEWRLADRTWKRDN